MKQLITEDLEKNKILSIHKSLIKEQHSSKEIDEQLQGKGDINSQEATLRKAEKDKCLKNGRLLTNANRSKFVYRATTKSGKEVDFFADMTYKFKDGSKSGKWACPEMPSSASSASSASSDSSASSNSSSSTNKSTTPPPKPPKPLDQSQKDLLRRLESDGWYVMDPPPSEFVIDQGDYERADLTKAQDDKNPGFKYNSSLYFKSSDFKEFFVYKKKIGQAPPKVTRGNKIEYPIESCRIAINGLWKNLDKPRTYPLDDAMRGKYEEVARGCQEKVMFAPILKKRLKDLDL